MFAFGIGSFAGECIFKAKDTFPALSSHIGSHLDTTSEKVRHQVQTYRSRLLRRLQLGIGWRVLDRPSKVCRHRTTIPWEQRKRWPQFVGTI